MVNDKLRYSIEYFCLHGLPLLRRCQPSSLWDYLVTELVSPQPGLQHITAALGMYQRLVDQWSVVEDQRCDTVQEAHQLYAKAISSLRRDVGQVGVSKEARVPLACLLMVILESIRGSSTHLLVHLRCGLHILRERRGTVTQEVREVERLFRHIAVNAAVFDPISLPAQAVRNSLAEHPEAEACSDPLEKMSQLVTYLLRAMTSVLEPDMSLSGHAPPSYSLEGLRDLQRDIEQAIDEKLEDPESIDSYSLSVYGFAKARCIMARIYIDCAWTGRQIDYDTEQPSFRQIVDIVERSLGLMRSLNSSQEHGNVPAAFSIGLSAQSTLMHVIQQCRDADTRHRALKLLNQCSRYEGIYNTALVEAVCRGIIDLEEQSVGGPGIFIPEHCRVHHYSLIGMNEGAGDCRAVRLYRRHSEHGEFIAHDIELKVEK